ncbi:copper chaperone PCu(A)C [Jannaschia seosinensis]|nr:copper chaperone PCu(A)C [Jannaschia seosinensis]
MSRILPPLLPAVFAALMTAPAALAQEYDVGDLSIVDPFALATVGNAPVAGGYLEIVNEGEADDRLVAIRVAPEVAGMVQLHEMRLEDGVMRMDAVAGGIPVPAGARVVLERGGLHVMFMRLPDGLEAGRQIPATLVFENAGEVEVIFAVETRGARQEGSQPGPSDAATDHGTAQEQPSSHGN